MCFINVLPSMRKSVDPSDSVLSSVQNLDKFKTRSRQVLDKF